MHSASVVQDSALNTIAYSMKRIENLFLAGNNRGRYQSRGGYWKKGWRGNSYQKGSGKFFHGKPKDRSDRWYRNNDSYGHHGFNDRYRSQRSPTPRYDRHRDYRRSSSPSTYRNKSQSPHRGYDRYDRYDRNYGHYGKSFGSAGYRGRSQSPGGYRSNSPYNRESYSQRPKYAESEYASRNDGQKHVSFAPEQQVSLLKSRDEQSVFVIGTSENSDSVHRAWEM